MNLWETFQKLNKIYEAKERLDEGEKINIPDYNQEHEIDSYVIVSNDSDGKYFKQNWEAEIINKLNAEEEYAMDYDDTYYSLITNNLGESEKYPSIEEAMSALERAINDYTSGDVLSEKVNNNTFIVDWTGVSADKSDWYSYTIKPLYFRKTAYLELEEKFTEENSHEDQLVEGKKIAVPDYDQHPSIDSYVIEVTCSWDNQDCYLKKGWLINEEAAVDYWWEANTENLEEAERYDSIESARKAVTCIVDNSFSAAFGQCFDYKWKNKQYLRATYDERDQENIHTNDEDWTWVDYRIKPLYVRKTVYLELGE